MIIKKENCGQYDDNILQKTGTSKGSGGLKE